MDKTAKVLHGSAERLHNSKYEIPHTLLCLFTSFLTHSFISNTFNLLLMFLCVFLSQTSLFSPFSPLGFYFSFPCSVPLCCIVGPVLIYFFFSSLSCTLLLTLNISRCTFPFSPLLPLLSFSPFSFTQIGFPALPPLIAYDFPLISQIALCFPPNISPHLIPALLLHQTNSYIIQHGNERVRGSTRPPGLIRLLYPPITALPCPYLCAPVGRRSCPSNYTGVRGIAHADEQPCNILSISIIRAWQVNTHTHTQANKQLN